MAKVNIKQNVCKGCGLCINTCPKKILELTKQEINKMGYNYARVTNLDACIGCALCAVMCPDCAIDVE